MSREPIAITLELTEREARALATFMVFATPWSDKPGLGREAYDIYVALGNVGAYPLYTHRRKADRFSGLPQYREVKT